MTKLLNKQGYNKILFEGTEEECETVKQGLFLLGKYLSKDVCLVSYYELEFPDDADIFWDYYSPLGIEK